MALAVGVAVALADLRITGNRWTAPFLLAVMAGDKLLTGGLKAVVDRARPDLKPRPRRSGPSFPSGHSSTAAALGPRSRWSRAGGSGGARPPRWRGRRSGSRSRWRPAACCSTCTG